jgi:electron transport complex protein RnfG
MSNVKYILRIALMLLLITSVMAAALAAVNQFTAPMIAKFQEEKTQEAIELVLPGGGEEISFTDASGLVSAVYASENGYAVEVNPVGFDGAVTMMVGIDTQGSVLGISVISHTETAGLGAVAAAKTSAGETFRGQFVGMNGTLAVTKDGGAVDSITGATITSRAICTGINAALACVGNLG